MPDAHTADWLLLQHAPKLGNAAQQQLLLQFGSAAAIRTAGRGKLSAAGLGTETIDYLLQGNLPDAVLRALEWEDADNAHSIVTLDDADYPVQLKNIHNPPPLLYVLGQRALLSDPQLAIVGSRNPTAGGRDNARQFAEHFARSGLVITSGLALGIDAAAHEGALSANAPTIAVMATGIDRIYPASHKKLAAAIAESGALISEMPLTTEPLPELFPQRNRIISGLSLGVLVVEAAQRSGSLITARLAMEQAREVFAIPGSIHNPLAKGCHRLIRQGAKLVESADDILEELAPQLRLLLQHHDRPAAQHGGDDTLDADYQRLLDALGYDAFSIDQLAERSGFSVQEVASMLLILELRGQVHTEAGGLYSRSKSR